MYQPLLRRVRWGIGWGLVFAAILSLWLLVPVLFGWPSRFVEAGVTPLIAVALYVLAGLLGGTIVGLSAPLAKSARGAAAVGALAAIPAYGGAGLLVLDETVPSVPFLATMLIVALLVGSAAGAIYYRIFYSDIQRAVHRQHRFVRRRARTAFNHGDFAEAVELFEHMPGELTANDQHRLEAARAKIVEGNAT